MSGRDPEMSALADAFADASSGVQRTVLITAEAGGGKTRLIREAVRQFFGDATVLQGWCLDLGEPGLPFAPFVSVLRQVLKERGLGNVGTMVGREGTRELSRLLPALGPAPSEGDPGMARSRLFESLRTLFETLAAEAPVVLVLEDLHWADRATRDLLLYLVRNLQGSRLLLLASYRTEVLRGAHPLRSGLVELARVEGVTTLLLPRLSRAHVAQQIQASLGREPSSEVVAAVYDRAEGVPLFTEAMLRHDGSVRSGVPGSLRDLLLGPAGGLSTKAREVLGAIAIGSFHVQHRLLSAVVGSEGLDAAVREAVASGLLVSDGEAGYVFRHALIREAVREDLLPGERCHLHRAYARALDADPSLCDETWAAAALALHWREAGDAVESMRAAWRAAGEAGTRLAHTKRLEMLEHVLALWDRVVAGSRPEGVDRAGLLELAADAACWAVEPDRGLDLVEAGLAEPMLAADDSRVAALLLQRAMMRQQQMHPGELEDLELALCLAPQSTQLRAETLGQICRALHLHGHGDRVRPLADELSRLAEHLGDKEWLVEAMVAAALANPARDDVAVTSLREALCAAESMNSGRLEMIARVALAETLHAQGAHAAAVEEAQAAWRRTRQLGQARYMGASVAYLDARALAAAGRWDDAVEIIAEALDLGPSPLGRAQLNAVNGLLAAWRGNIETAERSLSALNEAASKPQDAPQIAATAAQLVIEIAWLHGDCGSALIACRAIESLRGRLGPRELWPVITSAWRVCVNATEAEAVRLTLVESMEHLAEPGPAERAFALMCRAERSSRSRRGDAKAWTAAVAAWDALGCPHPLAYALLRQGAASMDSGNRGHATAALRRAAGLARRLAAAPLEAQIAVVARRARVDLWPENKEAGSAPPMGLTRRELEVLRLVSEGRSNREIAGDLFITAKTASVHVSNILTKLHVSSRGAAAAAALRLGLFGR
jgi:DNA-binding CsgD family transcriptional regulator/tetratricopeptide (TPR) repeat protein